MKSKKPKGTDLKSSKKTGEYTNPQFSELFESAVESDILEHEARMIMYRFLSEIERVAGKKRGLKKRFADAIGTSQSFVTQLFNGDKIINLHTLAKLQSAFGIKFMITAEHPDQESNIYRSDPGLLEKSGKRVIRKMHSNINSRVLQKGKQVG